jgi:diguanylate cyclase (GGDEF)-like protein
LLRQELEALVATDVLTGLASRRKFMETLEKEIKTGLRYGRPFGFLITDLDDFGAYNNSFGHQEGDQLLRLAGSTLLGTIRKSDMAGRYGGEEFSVLVLECNDRLELQTCAEKIRLAYEEALCPPTSRRQVTVSIGGSLFPDDGSSTESLIEAADKRLYQAKAGGKNQVVV